MIVFSVFLLVFLTGLLVTQDKVPLLLQSLLKVVGTPTVSRYICLSTIIPSKNLTSPSPAPPFNVGFDV